MLAQQDDSKGVALLVEDMQHEIAGLGAQPRELSGAVIDQPTKPGEARVPQVGQNQSSAGPPLHQCTHMLLFVCLGIGDALHPGG